MSLSALNATLESTGGLNVNLTPEWIWGSDPEEPLTPTVMLNRCHLLGLLVARLRRSQPQVPIPSLPRLAIVAPPPSQMNLRQLCDTLDNLCVELPRGMDTLTQSLAAVSLLLDACFTWFGQFVEEGGTGEVLNDSLCVQACEQHQEGAALLQLNRQCIRRVLVIFLVLYRHVHLATIAQIAPPVHHDCGIRKHHMEASNEEFDLLCMRMSLPAAAVINYKHDFSGFFSHISQVAYFHNPVYQRTPRVPITALHTATPDQVLPALMQLYPEIKVHYEEDNIDITKPLGYWAWLILPGRIYLAAHDTKIYHSSNLTALIKVYLQSGAAQGQIV